MAGTPLPRPLWACTLSISTKVSLLAAIRALTGNYSDCPGSARAYQLQPDPANSAAILIGDENVAVSPQQCGVNMAAGSGLFYGATSPALAPISSLYAVAVSGPQLLNLMVISE